MGRQKGEGRGEFGHQGVQAGRLAARGLTAVVAVATSARGSTAAGGEKADELKTRRDIVGEWS
jgi:hypothetical protein